MDGEDVTRVVASDCYAVMKLVDRDVKGGWCDECGNEPGQKLFFGTLTYAQFHHSAQSPKIEPCERCGLNRVKSPCDGCADYGLEECHADCKNSCVYCEELPRYITGWFKLCGGCIASAKEAAARDGLAGWCDMLWHNAQC